MQQAKADNRAINNEDHQQKEKQAQIFISNQGKQISKEDLKSQQETEKRKKKEVNEERNQNK